MGKDKVKKCFSKKSLINNLAKLLKEDKKLLYKQAQ